MANVQILMPMGGLGSRFADAGYTTPKALIPVDGKAMFMRALDSFASLQDSDFLFVIRKEHVDQHQLDEKIKELLPAAKITILEGNTRGAVETAMKAAPDIADDAPIIVADCDIFFESAAYFEKVKKCEETGGPDGMLLTFQSDEPRYSYVMLDDEGKAVRTAEKVVISNHAILGGYFFNTGKLFKDLATEFVSNDLPDGLKEYFMSHLFNMMIERGKKIEIADTDVMHIFGTPEELTYYQENYENK